LDLGSIWYNKHIKICLLKQAQKRGVNQV
jgi:hypothetical protein